MRTAEEIIKSNRVQPYDQSDVVEAMHIYAKEVLEEAKLRVGDWDDNSREWLNSEICDNIINDLINDLK